MGVSGGTPGETPGDTPVDTREDTQGEPHGDPTEENPVDTPGAVCGTVPSGLCLREVHTFRRPSVNHEHERLTTCLDYELQTRCSLEGSRVSILVNYVVS